MRVDIGKFMLKDIKFGMLSENPNLSPKKEPVVENDRFEIALQKLSSTPEKLARLKPEDINLVEIN